MVGNNRCSELLLNKQLRQKYKVNFDSNIKQRINYPLHYLITLNHAFPIISIAFI